MLVVLRRMYPSDDGYYYGGGNIKRYNKSAVLGISDDSQFIWTMSSISSYEVNVWFFSYWGTNEPAKHGNSMEKGSIYPSFYLDKNVVITGGTGTSTNPYLIDLP